MLSKDIVINSKRPMCLYDVLEYKKDKSLTRSAWLHIRDNELHVEIEAYDDTFLRATVDQKEKTIHNAIRRVMRAYGIDTAHVVDYSSYSGHVYFILNEEVNL